ncbi:MAG: hypothetical protein ACPKQO_00300 [Nitrososphaeraceae archaeon]
MRDIGLDEKEDYRLVVDLDNEDVDSELLISASNRQGKSLRIVGGEDFDTLYLFYDHGAPNKIKVCPLYDEFSVGHCEEFKTSGNLFSVYRYVRHFTE